MRLHLVRGATAEEVASTPPASSDWSAFLSTFKEAVRRRDLGLLFRMRARSFSDAISYAYSQPQTPAEELARVKFDCVERALAEGMESSGNAPLGRAQRVIVEKQNRFHVEYNRASKVRLTFIQDRDSQWRWSYVDYPSEESNEEKPPMRLLLMSLASACGGIALRHCDCRALRLTVVCGNPTRKGDKS